MTPSYWAKLRKLITYGLAAVTIWGCASTPQQCDPANRDAGLLDKAGCVYGGHYQQRLDQKQGQLLDEQHTNQLFRATYETLQLEAKAISADISQQQASLQRTHIKIEALLEALHIATVDNQQLQHQIGRVQQHLQQWQHSLAQAQQRGEAIPVLQQRQQLAELELQVQDLYSTLNLR